MIGYQKRSREQETFFLFAGRSTNACVTHISNHGIWLLTHDKELFMPYEEFPWFKDQPVKAIINVEEQTAGHFYWPDIDVDLTVESIEHPVRSPLKATTTS